MGMAQELCMLAYNIQTVFVIGFQDQDKEGINMDQQGFNFGPICRGCAASWERTYDRHGKQYLLGLIGKTIKLNVEANTFLAVKAKILDQEGIPSSSSDFLWPVYLRAWASWGAGARCLCPRTHCGHQPWGRGPRNWGASSPGCSLTDGPVRVAENTNSSLHR